MPWQPHWSGLLHSCIIVTRNRFQFAILEILGEGRFRRFCPSNRPLHSACFAAGSNKSCEQLLSMTSNLGQMVI
jgi:hypothetical protein